MLTKIQDCGTQIQELKKKWERQGQRLNRHDRRKLKALVTALNAASTKQAALTGSTGNAT